MAKTKTAHAYELEIKKMVTDRNGEFDKWLTFARLLEGMTAEDIIGSEAFRKALTSYAAIEVRLMKRHIRSKFLSTVQGGLNTAMRMVMRDEWNADTLTEIFRQVIEKRCNRPASERELVRAICMRAYASAMREIVEEKRNLLTKSEIR